MRGLYRGLRSADEALSATTAKWWAERRMIELAPPRTVQDHRVEARVTTRDEDAFDLGKLSDKEIDDLDRLTEKASKPQRG